MRTPLIAGNWKMNTTIPEAVKLVQDMLPALEKIKSVESLVCPPFVSLASVAAVLKGSSVGLGAQNMYFEEKGAYTGEVSPLMLAGMCQYVILGHSERRQYFKETNELVNKKVKMALQHHLKPIMCIGESLQEYETKRTEEIVTVQLKGSFQGVTPSEQLVVAYEPVWAIGTGKAATGDQANKVIGLIRSTLSGLFGKTNADKIRILYGGSVTRENSDEFMSQPEIDGALVGGASLKADLFTAIVSQTAALRG